jgi:hypothetical protein
MTTLTKTGAGTGWRSAPGLSIAIVAACLLAAGGAFLAVRALDGGESVSSPRVEQAVDAARSPEQVFRNAPIAVHARVDGSRQVELWLAADGTAAPEGEGDRYTGIAFAITPIETFAGGDQLEGRELEVHITLRQESPATAERPALVVTQEAPDLRAGGEYVLFLVPGDFAGIRALSAATLPWAAEVRDGMLHFVPTDDYLAAVRPFGHDGVPAAFEGITLAALPARLVSAQATAPDAPGDTAPTTRGAGLDTLLAELPSLASDRAVVDRAIELGLVGEGADPAFCLKAESAVRDTAGRAIDFGCAR